MRILTAGFDRSQTERLGDLLTAAGHTVLSASGASSCRTLASSAAPDVLLVPEGASGDEAAQWASDLLEDTPVVRLADDADPTERLERLRPSERPAENPTEDLSEAEIFAAIEDAEPTVPALPDISAPVGDVVDASLFPTGRETGAPRRGATLRSTSTGPVIADKLNEVRFGDYHAILEVQPAASTYVVRQQYDTLRALYTPAGWHAPVGPTDLESLRVIGQGLEDAFAVLGHPSYHARYEAALDAARQ